MEECKLGDGKKPRSVRILDPVNFLEVFFSPLKRSQNEERVRDIEKGKLRETM